MPEHSSIHAVILAGGLGRRMGGRDKGLVHWRGRPLVEHVLDAIRPQVQSIVINTANPEYARFGLPLLDDALPGREGPLAGLLAALEAAPTDLVLSVPCDMPTLPRNLVERLHIALTETNSQVCGATDGERLHPTVALWRRSLAPLLRRYLETGERRLTRWFEGCPHALVTFDLASLANANTPADLDALT